MTFWSEDWPDEWREQGSPEITEYCPVCRCRTIPSHRGVCLWCETPMPGSENYVPPTTNERIIDALEAEGPGTVNDLQLRLPDMSLDQLRPALSKLAKRERVRRAGEVVVREDWPARTLWELAA